MLQVTIEDLRETVILHCSGRIVLGHETALLCKAVGQHRRNIILDLSMVDAVDAAGIGALVSLQAAGVYLQLMNPSIAIREVLRVTNLNSVFEICSSPLAGIQNEGSDPDRSAGLMASPLVAIAT